jgi:tripartite-type tricarboxylate transporter receptor subunit TctC
VVWNAIAAPAATPREIIAKLSDALNKSLDSPEIRQRFSELAAIAPEDKDRGSAPLQRLISSEVDRWSDLIKRANIQP